MPQQFSIKNSEDLMHIFNSKKQEIVLHSEQIAKESVKTELDLFEFNLFLASMGKGKLDSSTKAVRELRKKADKGEIDLSIYEKLADEF